MEEKRRRWSQGERYRGAFQAAHISPKLFASPRERSSTHPNKIETARRSGRRSALTTLARRSESETFPDLLDFLRATAVVPPLPPRNLIFGREGARNGRDIAASNVGASDRRSVLLGEKALSPAKKTKENRRTPSVSAARRRNYRSEIYRTRGNWVRRDAAGHHGVPLTQSALTRPSRRYAFIHLSHPLPPPPGLAFSLTFTLLYREESTRVCTYGRTREAPRRGGGRAGRWERARGGWRASEQQRATTREREREFRT